MASTVLIVEDDPTTTDLVRMYLNRDGHRVLTAADGAEGLQLARDSRPDLVVLDVMLPRMNGMEVCRTLRMESTVPVIMLTARVDEEDRLTGLEAGADDYVTKPFSPRELAARVRAVLRRSARFSHQQGPAHLEWDGLVVDVPHHQVTVDRRPITVTPTELRILAMFLQEPGRVFAREEIISRVFGDDFEGFDRTIDTHISNLRRKLEPTGGKPRFIQTVYGSGYRVGHA